MKNRIAMGLLALMAASPSLAETPVFRDQVLSLDGVTVMTTTGPVYYGDVKLQQQPDGDFRLVQAEKSPLSIVDSVNIVIAQSQPPQISAHIVAIQTNACVARKEPAVTRSGNEFSVILAETTQAPGSVCMSFAAVTPFQLDLKLNTSDLSSGTYSVNVNGKTAQFSL